MAYCPQCGTLLAPNALKVGRCSSCQAPLFADTADDGIWPVEPDIGSADKEQSFYYPRAAAPQYQEYLSSPYGRQGSEQPPPPPRRRRSVIALSIVLALLLVGSVVIFAANSAPGGHKSATAIARDTPTVANTLAVPTATASGGTVTTILPTAAATVSTAPQPTRTTPPTATPNQSLTPMPTPALPAHILITPASYQPSNCFGATTTFQLANTGGSPLNWIASPSDAFLSVYPKSGMLASGNSVVVQVSGLTGTSSRYVITIADPRAANSPQQFTVLCS